MKLNHINLPVQDVLAASSFFETCLGFTSENSVVNDTISILRGQDGFVLVLMLNKFNQDGNSAYPDAFHIGFLQDTNAEVISVYERLKLSGINVGDEPKRIRKTFGFYFRYQHILIEVSTDVKE